MTAEARQRAHDALDTALDGNDTVGVVLAGTLIGLAFEGDRTAAWLFEDAIETAGLNEEQAGVAWQNAVRAILAFVAIEAVSMLER